MDNIECRMVADNLWERLKGPKRLQPMGQLMKSRELEYLTWDIGVTKLHHQGTRVKEEALPRKLQNKNVKKKQGIIRIQTKE